MRIHFKHVLWILCFAGFAAPFAATATRAQTGGQVTSASDAPSTSPHPLTPAELTRRIETLFREAQLGEKAKLGVFAQIADTRQILVNTGAEEPMKPASCFKLITTAAGLRLLGPDFRWTTEIASPGVIRNGVLVGDVFLIGRGDPSLGGRFHPTNSRDLTWQMRDWAERMKAMGIRKIQGDIIGDDNEFDDVFFGRGWYPAERAEWYCAEVSALSFNDNCIDILWKAGRSPNRPVTFTLNPPTRYCQIGNFVQTVAEGEGGDISYSREEKSNYIRAEGKLAAQTEKYDWAAIHNPTLFTATVFKEVLESRGIQIQGAARDIDDISSPSARIEGRIALVTHESPPLSKIVEVINRNSQNLYAEALLRTLGKSRRGEGSFEAGARVLEDFILATGIHRGGFCPVDGSGLSYLNRVSARTLGELLVYMDSTPEREIYQNSLPQGGERGTLARRFQDDDLSREAGKRIFGKTGYIGGVHSMSGFIEGRERIAFSILLNDFSVSDTQARNLVDRIAVEIALWNRPEPETAE